MAKIDVSLRSTPRQGSLAASMRCFPKIVVGLVGFVASGVLDASVAQAIIVAQDDYNSASGVSYGGTSGSGLGAHTKLQGTVGGIYHATSDRRIDGAGSLGVFSDGVPEGLGRTVLSTAAFAMDVTAVFEVSMRFDIPNTQFFKGANVKTSMGSIFSSNELISIGMVPSMVGNNGLLITGSTFKTIDFGEDIRGKIVDATIQWNTITGAYIVTASLRDVGTPLSVQGQLQNRGTYLPGAIGFANFDVGGSGNDVYFDNVLLQAVTVPESSPAASVPVVASLGAICYRWRNRRRGSRAEN